MKNIKVLRGLKLLSWIGLTVLFFVISAAAVGKRKEIHPDKIMVRFKNEKNLAFINSSDVLKEVNHADPYWKGQRLDKIKFNLIENAVKQNEYVKNAELFIDNQNQMNVLIEPKEPIARIHTDYGSYYLSELWDKMSLSNSFSKRIVHISGRVNGILNPKSSMDSSINISIKKLMTYIDENKIWKDAIDQIYIEPDGKIELVLMFCKPIVQIGRVDENFEKRMNKVMNFFKTALRYHNLDEYKELDFQYSQQVVARR